MQNHQAGRAILFALAMLIVFAGPAAADQFDELIAQAQQAKAAGDLIGARRALAEAQRALSAAPSATEKPGGTRAASANTSERLQAAAPIRTPPVAQPKPEETKSVFAALADNGFRMQLESGKSGPDAEAAVFAFVQDVEAGTQTDFSANFLLGWNSAAAKVSGIDPFTGKPRTVPYGSSSFKGQSNPTWSWDVSVQGKLASGEDSGTDSWRFRIGLDADHTSSRVMANSRTNADTINDVLARGGTMQEALKDVRRRQAVAKPGFYLGSWWSMSAKLEADRDFENQRLSAELLTTPTTSLPGNGIIYPRNSEAAAHFIWRPYLGVDAGGVVSSNGAWDDVDDTLRIMGRLKAMLSLDFLAKALALPSVELSASDTVRYLAESGDAYNYLTSQFRFGLAKDVSFAFTYVNGEDAPSFQPEERFGGSLAVKF